MIGNFKKIYSWLPRLFFIVLALFVVFMAHSKMTQMHQRVTELENEMTKIHDYGLLERKQLVEDLSSTNTEQLITRINFAINAIDDSKGPTTRYQSSNNRFVSNS